MKKVFLAATALLFSGAILAQKTIADVAKFTSESINLGTIKQGVPATATFVVTNIGTEPLIIEQATPTCGKTGTITATFNAAALNRFEKHMTVKFAGIDAVQSITISGDVVAAEAAPQPVVETAPAADVVAQPVVATKAAPVAKKAKVTPKTNTKKAVVPKSKN
jgi:hypothetical protein